MQSVLEGFWMCSNCGGVVKMLKDCSKAHQGFWKCASRWLKGAWNMCKGTFNVCLKDHKVRWKFAQRSLEDVWGVLTKGLNVLHGCSKGAQVFKRCLKVLRGWLKRLNGFVSMFQSSSVFCIRFVISWIGIAFIQLFSSGLEIMFSGVMNLSLFWQSRELFFVYPGSGIIWYWEIVLESIPDIFRQPRPAQTSNGRTKRHIEYLWACLRSRWYNFMNYYIRVIGCFIIEFLR